MEDLNYKIGLERVEEEGIKISLKGLTSKVTGARTLTPLFNDLTTDTLTKAVAALILAKRFLGGRDFVYDFALCSASQPTSGP